jgi:hypothetical protein
LIGKQWHWLNARKGLLETIDYFRGYINRVGFAVKGGSVSMQPSSLNPSDVRSNSFQPEENPLAGCEIRASTITHPRGCVLSALI